MQVLQVHWFVRLPQLNQWCQRSCTAYDWKAHQNGRRIWLYNAGICQGSSDFFSFSDDYKIFALRDSKPSPLNDRQPPQPPPVLQHPLGLCDSCHRTAVPVSSPHTSYRWRRERVIEPIKCMGIIRRT